MSISLIWSPYFKRNTCCKYFIGLRSTCHFFRKFCKICCKAHIGSFRAKRTSGRQAIDIFDDLYGEGDICVVLPRHEQGLIHVADGYARSTGKTGVCLVTSGPGTTNLVTGIATANYDCGRRLTFFCRLYYDNCNYLNKGSGSYENGMVFQHFGHTEQFKFYGSAFRGRNPAVRRRFRGSSNSRGNNEAGEMERDLFLSAHTKESYNRKVKAIEKLVESADIETVKSYLTSVLAENEKMLVRFHGIVKRETEDEDVRRMINNGDYWRAFELMNHIFVLTGSVDMDDSDGGTGMMADRIYELWKEILEKADAEEKRKMFQWFTAHLDGSVIDYLEEYIEQIIMEGFEEEEYTGRWRFWMKVYLWIKNTGGWFRNTAGRKKKYFF